LKKTNGSLGCLQRNAREIGLCGGTDDKHAAGLGALVAPRFVEAAVVGEASVGALECADD
jgi:hypothetical protein